MASLPAYNPRLPYVGKIPGDGLRHGVMIRINGTLNRNLEGYERFSINLLCEPIINPLGDVPFHFDIRLYENCIVRNNHISNVGWGTEERSGGCPIQRGQPYEILILAQTNCYKVAINGKHFCEFYHRMPLSRAHYVHLTGDSTVTNVRMEHDIGPTAPPFPIGQNSMPGIIPPPTQYMPNYSIPPNAPQYHPPAYNAPVFNPSPYNNSQATIHRPILTCPPYPQVPPHESNIGPNYQPRYGVYPPGNSYRSGPVLMNKEHSPDNKKTKKYLKYAAIAGGVGLGAYALSRVVTDLNSDSD